MLSVQDSGQPARAGSPEAPPPAPTSPSPPDFTNVSDILGGRRVLFPVVDLMITQPNADDSLPLAQLSQTALFTDDGGQGEGPGCNNMKAPPDQNGFQTTVNIGRLYNLPNDVVVTVTSEGVIIGSWGEVFCDNTLLPSSPVPGSAPNPGAMPAGDFTGDGFTDFAVLFGSTPYIVTARDVNNTSAGVFWSDAGTPPFPATGLAALAAGDFDGDGNDELAMISTPFDISSCQDAQPCINVTIYNVQATSNNGQLERIHLVNIGSTQFTGIELPCVAGISATAGAFNGATNPNTGILQDQLLIAYSAGLMVQGVCFGSKTNLASIGATAQSTDPPSLEVSLADQLATDLGANIGGLASGHLDFFAPEEQAVLLTSDLGLSEASSYINIVTLDPALNIGIANSAPMRFANFKFGKPLGVALGNFDQVTDPNTPLALEVAVLTAEADSSSSEQPFNGAYTYTVNPANNFALSEVDYGYYGIFNSNQATPPSISSGDLQGRSILLGEPTKLTVEHVQPQLVLGMPPMHVDWVTDANGMGPAVLNLSAVLSSFYSSYESSDNTTVSSSSQNTTSWTPCRVGDNQRGFSVGKCGDRQRQRQRQPKRRLYARQDGREAERHLCDQLVQRVGGDRLRRQRVVQRRAPQPLHLSGHRADGVSGR